MELVIKSLEDISDAANRFLELTEGKKNFAFYGEMGSGKTTFIKAICQNLGVNETITSPTFSIVNEYESDNGPIYHFDFYRIKNKEEAFDFGYEEYLYGDGICFIEWPELIEDLLPDDVLRVKIEERDDKSRMISF